ncbi:MAG: hypothetical protein JWR23_2148 [Mucilaginibacter sp.]|nr:hypothetical protein [Mucilaginibacter sp.]
MPRLSLVKLTEGLTIEQLNKIPAGFNNNIIWNLAHMIAAQQGLCYRRAGIDTIVDETFFMTYKPDTKPEKFINAAELETIKALLISTVDQLETDIKNNLFTNYTPWTTRYGVEINNISEAVNFLPFHDGLHVGYIMALKRAL